MWNENVRCGSEAWADITCHKVEYNDTFGQKQSLISSVLFPEQAYNKYLEIDLVGKIKREAIGGKKEKFIVMSL